MVATRRGALTGAGEKATATKTNTAVRKKSTRITTAEPATAAPTNKVVKPRVTRAKTKDIAPADNEEGNEQSEEDVVEESKPSTARQATNRAKRATQTAATKATSKPTRATGTKSTRANVLNDRVDEEQPIIKARATRNTRATAAAASAKVLSPKKITQISKAPTRSTKSSAAKLSTKAYPTKAAAPARPTRRRAVSDENADLAGFEEPGAVKTKKTVVAAGPKPSTKPRNAPVVEIDSDSEMSSRPTTPSDSPKLDSSRNEEALIEPQRDESEDDSTDHADEDCDESEDELCGPKTPMRRCSPREAARYSGSPQRSTRARSELSSVGANFGRGTRQGTYRRTPQTQVPRFKLGFPIREEEPMTIARASNRAMVFPELKPFEAPLSIKATGSSDLESDELSRQSLGDADKMRHAFTGEQQQAVDTVEAAASSSQSSPATSNADDISVIDSDSDIDASETESAIPSNIDQAVYIDEAPDASRSVQENGFRFDSTLDSNNGLAGHEVFEDDDTVVIASNRLALEQVSPFKDFGASVLQSTATTPRPETLVWENLRQDDSLHFDLASDNCTPDTLPEPDQTEILSPTANSLLTEQAMKYSDDAMDEFRAELVSQHEGLDDHNEKRQSMMSARQSLDATIHLSQYIDVDSLTNVVHGFEEECANDIERDFELDSGNGNITFSTPTNSPKRGRYCDQADVTAEPGTPRYALPTMASASKRRKSMPALTFGTPIKATIRPQTSDGASISRLPTTQGFEPLLGSNPFETSAFTTTPLRSRPIDTFGVVGAATTASPTTPKARFSRLQTPSASSPRRRKPRPATKAPQTIAGARFRGVPPRSVRQTPTSSTVKKLPVPGKERYPGLPPRSTYEELAETPMTNQGSDPNSSTPQLVSDNRSATSTARKTYTEPIRTPVAKGLNMLKPATPDLSGKKQVSDLPSRRAYAEHARTAMVPTRFRTPTQVPAKRPASAMKASSLRDLARRDAKATSTPVKTPLHLSAMTPGPAPMTPHPGAPLQGVYALVDVWTNDASSATSAFIALLQRLGAKTTKSWSKRLTHVVYKSGSPSIVHRLCRHNKEVEQSGVGNQIFCVNSRWVADCDAEGKHMDETSEEYVVDVDEVCRGSKRRKKSMEPTALLSIGNSWNHDRQSSLGRASLSRSPSKQSPMKQPSPAKEQTESFGLNVSDKENTDSRASSSPATPAYLAAPSLLTQQTAPMNKVRKLDLGTKDQSRRTTVWNLEF